MPFPPTSLVRVAYVQRRGCKGQGALFSEADFSSASGLVSSISPSPPVPSGGRCGFLREMHLRHKNLVAVQLPGT